MDDLGDLVNDDFIFDLPLWTVGYVSTDAFRIAVIPLQGHIKRALGVFTDMDQAERYKDMCVVDGEEFYVFSIDNPQGLETWFRAAEKMGLTHVAIDFTIIPSRRQEGARLGTIAEMRRVVKKKWNPT